MAPILVGTASWTDKSLIECGRFYPRKSLTAEERLRFYASQFPMVEVDSSYYAIPSANTAQLWAERTPQGFEFNVKAFRLFTGHPATPQVLHEDLRRALGPQLPERFYLRQLAPEVQDELWRRFVQALAPLRAAGRLSAVHFQFAPWVLPNREGRALVAASAERMAGQLACAEFRHRSWFAGEQAAATLQMLRELGLAHTVVDAPQGTANTVPTVWEATDSRLALLRLHGRNTATWNVPGPAASDRFNYLYTQTELVAFVSPLRRLAQQVGKVHVVFNTNFEDQGPVGARLMARLLAEQQA
jgi:uncharacterized protein YecE (DUF72 family)